MTTSEWPYAPEGWSLARLISFFGLHITGVIHCGAWHAEEAGQYAECGIFNVWWIEANADVIPRVRAAVEPYGHHVIEALLGDEDGVERQFNVTNEDGLSSSVLEFGTHKNFSPHMVYVDRRMLTMRTLDSLVAEHGITGVNMLNMDLQGAEGMCLRGAQQLLPRLSVVYTEVNTAEVYEGCTQLPELDQMLHGFGRRKTWMVGELGWGDAIYTRDAPQMAEMVGGMVSGVGDQMAVNLPVAGEGEWPVGTYLTDVPPIGEAAPARPGSGTRVVVVVPSWNCSQWIDRCLGSLVGQTRPPDEVLVIDDASTEPGYWDTVTAICQRWGWQSHRNPENRRMPFNLWWAMHEASWDVRPDDAVVLLDGDDYFRPTAIERIAEVYTDPAVWLSWGSYERDGQWAGWDPNPATPWPPEIVAANQYRRMQGWIPFNHTLAFRRWLFDLLTEQELQDDAGQWFQAGYDFALMMPLTELAGAEHGRFIADRLYVYNEGNPLSDNKLRAGECSAVHDIVRARPPRTALIGRPVPA